MQHRVEYWCRAAAVTLALIFLQTAAGLAQSTASQQSEEPDEATVFEDRIVTPQDLDEARPGATLPFRIIGWPFAKLLDGMEAGLISFEKNKIRQKIYDAQMRLAAIGFRPLFGGLGEGTGFGAGTVYEVPPGQETAVRLLGRMSFAGYQELAVNFISSPVPRSSLILLANYQWRPNEPYSGYGQGSSSSDRSSFALRQTSFAAQWEQRPVLARPRGTARGLRARYGRRSLDASLS